MPSFTGALAKKVGDPIRRGCWLSAPRLLLILLLAMAPTHRIFAEDLGLSGAITPKQQDLFRIYAAAVLQGTDGPDIAYWKQPSIDVVIHNATQKLATSPNMRIGPAFSWLSYRLDKESILHLEIKGLHDVQMTPVDAISHNIDIYVIDHDAYRALTQMKSARIDGHFIEDGYKGCRMARWIRDGLIVKAVGIIQATDDLPTNVQCFSRVLLYSLGLTFVPDGMPMPATEGLMALSRPNPGLVADYPTDIAVLKFLYGNLAGKDPSVAHARSLIATLNFQKK